MWSFIKNALISLLHSKYVVLLLFFLSLASTTLYTSYANASKNHADEYKYIMTAGKAADISIYQNYDYTFQIIATAKNNTAPNTLASTRSKSSSWFANDWNQIATITKKNSPVIPSAILQQQKEQEYSFSIVNPSNYVIYALQNNPSHYTINDFSSECFKTTEPWTARMPSENLSDYISKETERLLNELQTDTVSSVQGFINSKFNTKDKTNIVTQKFEALTISNQDHIYQIAEVNPNETINRILYATGSDGLLFAPTGQNYFSQFYQWFNEINGKVQYHVAIGDISKMSPAEVYPKYYLPLFEALYANIDSSIDPDGSLKQSFLNLITAWNAVYSQPNPNINFPLDQSSYTALNNFFKQKFSAGLFASSPNLLVLRWTSGLVPRVINIFNPASMQAVISTANVYHGDYSYSQEAFKQWVSFLGGTNETNSSVNTINPKTIGVKYNRNLVVNKLKEIKKSFPRSFVQVGSTSLIIVGAGVSPNFIYPNSTSSVIVDPKQSVLIYVNPGGFGLIIDANENANLASILYARFTQPTSLQEKESVINEINDWASNYMLFPKDLKSAYAFDDPTSLNAIAASRVVFLKNLTDSIDTVFLYVCIVAWLLTLVVSFFIIKNIVDKNRNIVSIFNANGFSMFKLLISFILLIMLPAFIGSICGFLIGIPSQEIVNGFLAKYWVTIKLGYIVSLGSFVYPVIVFNLILLLGSMLCGWFLTRKNLVVSMKSNENFKNSQLALILKKPLLHTGIITRFRASLVFNSFGKIFILAILIAISTSVFGFFITSLGKFNEARNFAKAEDHYAFAVNLQTPTKQSGPLKYTDYFNLGQTALGFANRGNDFKTTNNKPSWQNIEFPNASFLTKYDSDLWFLRDVIVSRLTTDCYLGVSGGNLGANAWNIARGVMPLDQLTSSNESYQKIMTYLYNVKAVKDDKNPNNHNGDYYIVKQSDGSYTLNDNCFQHAPSELLPLITVGFKPEFANFLFNNYFDIAAKLANQENPIYNYLIVYNTIGMDPRTFGGETFVTESKKFPGKYLYAPPKYAYLRIDATTMVDNFPIEIYGIQRNNPKDSNYLGPKIFLTNDRKNQLANSYLYEYPQLTSDLQNKVYDVIINNALAAKESLSVGSIFTIEPKNSYNRIFEPSHQITLKVIGISRGPKNPMAYVDYDLANQILGFPSNEENPNSYYYFNGYFAPAGDNLNFLTHTTTLFSMSGLYPGCANFQSISGDFETGLKATIENKNHDYDDQLLQLKKALNEDNLTLEGTQKYIQLLTEKYSNSIYQSVIKNLFSVQMDLNIFTATSSSISVLMNFSVALIIVMSFLVLIMISFLTINNLKSVAVKMLVLGFSKREVLSSFLAIYFPTFVIGVVLSIPLLSFLLGIFVNYIFLSLGIVLAVHTSIWVIAVGCFAVLVMLLFSFIFCYQILSKINLATSLKGFTIE